MNSTETTANATTTDKAANVAEQGAHVAPEKAGSKKGTSQEKGAPQAKKVAEGAGCASPRTWIGYLVDHPLVTVCSDVLAQAFLARGREELVCLGRSEPQVYCRTNHPERQERDGGLDKRGRLAFRVGHPRRPG